jgi:predicted Zn-dependent protease
MLSYSRDQERQADELGYEYMVRAGYNPVGQIKTFEMFQEMNKSEPGFIAAMLSSHPLTVERVQTARQRVDAAPSHVTSRPLQKKRFQQAVALQKKREPAYLAEAKGDALMQKKRYPAAADSYRQAAKLYSGDGVFLTKLAIAEYRQKALPQAKRDAARGAQISPGVYFPNFVAGAIHYQMKDYGQACEYLSRADRLLPSQPRNKLMLAASYERMGQRQTAARLYRQVINMAPKSGEARSAAYRMNQMGYRY